MESLHEVTVARAPYLSLGAWRRVFGGIAGKGALSLLDQAVVSGANFTSTIVVGRACGQQQLGVYSLGFTVVVFLACIQEALITTPHTVYGNRLQGGKLARYAGGVLLQQLLLSALAPLALVLAGITWTVVGAAPAPDLVWVLAAIAPGMLLREFCRRYAFAHLRMAAALKLDLAVTIPQLGGLLLLAGAGLLSAAAAFVVTGFACLVAAVVYLVAARRAFAPTLAALRRSMRQHWVLSRWLLGQQTAGVAQGYVVHWLLAAVLGAAATGAFSACLTAVMLSNPLIIGLGNVFGPRAARAYAESGADGVRAFLERAMLFTGVALGFYVTVIAVFGDTLLSLVFGAEYAGQGTTATLLALTLAISGLGMVADHGLRALERPDVSFRTSLLALVVTLAAAGGLLIPWQVPGAAWGFLLGTAAGVAVRCVAVWQLTSRRKGAA